jgi:hypothetical protein
MGKNIYRPKQKLWDHHERHGRTVTMEVKKMMEEKKLKRDTAVYKVISILLKQGGAEGLSAKRVWEIYSASNTGTYGTVGQTITSLNTTGMLQQISVVGQAGSNWKVRNPSLTADELYLQYAENKEAKKKKKAVEEATTKKPEKLQKEVALIRPTSTFDFKALRDALKGLIPDTITINVNHRVEIAFVGEQKGGKKK